MGLTSCPLKTLNKLYLQFTGPLNQLRLWRRAKGRGITFVLLVKYHRPVKGKKKAITSTGPGKWRKWGWCGGVGGYVTAMSFLISEFSLALKPPPRCNKSWHLFVTYDCISDCLGRDSIPAPRSAGDGGIARSERWRNTGVCGSNVLVSAILHLREIWRLNVGGDGGMTGGQKIGMCAACVLFAFRCVWWHAGVDGWLYRWMANYWPPSGSLFTQGGAEMLLRGDSHQLRDPRVSPGQLWGICPLSQLRSPPPRVPSRVVMPITPPLGGTPRTEWLNHVYWVLTILCVYRGTM